MLLSSSFTSSPLIILSFKHRSKVLYTSKGIYKIFFSLNKISGFVFLQSGSTIPVLREFLRF